MELRQILKDSKIKIKDEVPVEAILLKELSFLSIIEQRNSIHGLVTPIV